MNCQIDIVYPNILSQEIWEIIWEIADKMEQKDNLKAHKVIFHSDYGPFYYLKKTLKLQAIIGIGIGGYGIRRCEDRLEEQRQINLNIC